MIVIEVIESKSDGSSVVHGLFEFDALPTAGDRILVTDKMANGDEVVWLEVIRAHHLGSKVPKREPKSNPHTRVLAVRVADES